MDQHIIDCIDNNDFDKINNFISCVTNNKIYGKVLILLRSGSGRSTFIKLLFDKIDKNNYFHLDEIFNKKNAIELLDKLVKCNILGFTCQDSCIYPQNYEYLAKYYKNKCNFILELENESYECLKKSDYFNNLFEIIIFKKNFYSK
jgi:hypothetical protein